MISKNSHNTLSLVAVAAGLILLAAPSVQAEDWDFNLGLWAWGPTVQGTLNYEVTGETGHATVTPDDLLSSINFAAMVTLDARKGKWSVLGDVFYLDASKRKDTFIDLPEGAVDAHARLKLSTWITGLSGAYDLHRSDESSFSLLMGARYTQIDTNLHLAFDDGAVDRKFNSDVSSFDGVIGFKGHFSLGENFYVPYLMDIGAGDSDLTWQAVASVAYQFGWGDLALSYRYLDYENEDDSEFERVSFSGPAINFNFRF